jgi:hypothetical protein
MPDQVCLSQTTGRNKGNTILVEEKVANCRGLLNAVTEVFRTGITVGDKRVLHMHNRLSPAKVNKRNHITIK